MFFKRVLGWFKNLFGFLAKNFRLQHKEERLERSEKKDVLNEIIDTKEIDKSAKKELAQFNDEKEEVSKYQHFLNGFSSQVKKFLESKNPKYLQDSGDNLGFVTKEFKKIEKFLNGWDDYVSHMLGVSHKELEIINEDDKKLTEEKRILFKESRVLHQALKQGEKLDQVKKQGVMVKKNQLNLNLAGINNERKTLLEELISLHEKMKSWVEEQKEEWGKINVDMGQKKNEWQEVYDLLNEVEHFVSGFEKFLARASGVLNEVLISDHKMNDLSKKSAALMGDKHELDQYYEHLLVEEQLTKKAELEAKEKLAEAA